MSYKYGEFEDLIEFEHWCKQYGGTFTYLSELDTGTKFEVNNGLWKGTVIKEDEATYIQPDGNFNKHKIDNKYYAWIEILDV